MTNNSSQTMDVVDILLHPFDGYHYLWTLRDDRVDHYTLMGSCKPITVMIILYYLMVMYGPKWMEKRKAMNLKFFVFVYNIAIAILNLHIFSELSICSYRLSYNWWCEPVRQSTDPEEMRMVNAAYYYLWSKIFEFLDTFFIIVRKKNSQLSFLHVYHHSSMLAVCWVVGRWFPGGNAVLAALVNAFVHVVMYSYYGLSVFGQHITKYLWWKRYITVLQLAQFLLGIFIAVNMLINGCDYLKWQVYMAIIYISSYVVLFGQFYISAYISKTPQAKRKLSDCKPFNEAILKATDCDQRLIKYEAQPTKKSS